MILPNSFPSSGLGNVKIAVGLKKYLAKMKAKTWMLLLVCKNYGEETTKSAAWCSRDRSMNSTLVFSEI